MSDHQSLFEKAAAGNAEAVSGLLRAHLPGLRAYIRLHSDQALRAAESCSDLAQSVCMELVENLKGLEYRGEAAFRSWLFKLAMSKINDRRRYWLAQKRDRRQLDSASPTQLHEGQGYASIVTPSRVAMGLEEMEKLESCFDELPEDQRQVLIMSRVVGMHQQEIAAELGRSEDSVRGLLQRGMTRLSWLMSRE